MKFEYFKKMVAFVMAYSFTEPAAACPESCCGDSDDENGEATSMMPPMMVPMADMLNHVTDNNAKLTFGETALKMVTTRPIKRVHLRFLSKIMLKNVLSIVFFSL